MTDNPWLPIDTMPLSTVGTEVDILDDRRMYSGVTVSGIQYVLYSEPIININPGPIFGKPDTQWRPHV